LQAENIGIVFHQLPSAFGDHFVGIERRLVEIGWLRVPLCPYPALVRYTLAINPMAEYLSIRPAALVSGSKSMLFPVFSQYTHTHLRSGFSVVRCTGLTGK
jgi:hypothetical protein